MFEEKIKTAFEEMTPTAEQKEAMLRGIWEAHDGLAAQYRRRPVRRRVFAPVLAAALALILGSAALAAGTLGRVINWQGETIGAMAEPEGTPLPAELETARQERREAILMAAICEENELIAVRYADAAGWESRTNGLEKTVHSMEELEALLSEQEAPLKLPVNIPAGYELTQARVSYDCAEGYAYELVSAEEDMYGLTVERYEVPREGLIISGYDLDYRDEEGGVLYVSGMLFDEGMDSQLVMDESQTVQTADVEGMDDVLVAESAKEASLYVRQELAEPVSYTSRNLLFGAHPTEGGDRFGEIHYMASANALGAKQLITLFG